jgi:hypothetical protein
MIMVQRVRRLCLILIVTVSCLLAGLVTASTASAVPVRAAASQSGSLSSSTRCVFGADNPVDCESQDPWVTKDLYSGSGDCSATDQEISINWGDKTPVQNISTYGPSPYEKLPIGSHDYAKGGTYDIQVTGRVISGSCTFTPTSYTFTLFVATCSADAAKSAAQPGAVTAPGAVPAAAKANFFYAGVHQFAQADGARGDFRVADPEVAKGECHSLAELAVESADGKQIVEVGWIVDPEQFGGSTQPHLFVFHWVNGQPACYNDCAGGGFVPTSELAGAELSSGGEADLSIRYAGGRWVIEEDGYIQIGYYPESLWRNAGVTFTKAGLTQWFGEVAAGPNTTSPCSQMGTGELPSAGASADEITDMALIGGPRSVPSPGLYHTDPYQVERVSGNAIRFGGPGGANCPS